ncbi:hypothetical protein VNI00_010812 [Paramarasmius palmivorus]|uniref:DUF6535 domain-containing protein n=1 Tax=Paramarasmius palmivorus TaxID=297713 RepID=A0AAW0CHX2_9AGAR
MPEQKPTRGIVRVRVQHGTAEPTKETIGTKPVVDRSSERAIASNEGRMKALKDDLDTLIVFGVLLSIVATAFLIGPYPKLEEEPVITTALPFQQTLQLLQPDASQTVMAFKTDGLAILIDCFWFMSLGLSLSSTFFGVACKQQQPKEAALRRNVLRMTSVLGTAVLFRCCRIPRRTVSKA